MTYNTINDAVTMPGGEGTLLANRYRIVRQLGQGGMGSVWLAEDTQLDNKRFAIKMLPSILVSNKRAYRQLKDEALVAMKLTHTNIVTLRAFEENNGNPFLVMDYIEGQTLDDYLAENGKITEEETVRLLRPIASALDYAHGEGVVHRDVKPANVMIRKDGHPFVLDFGISREIQETMTRVTGKLSSGTLLYMSPEQLNGDAPKKVQDIYSFAAMAYECIKGEPPFVRGAIEDQIKNKPPEPLHSDGAFVVGIMAGLAKKPEDRPKTCAAVLEGKVLSRVERVERVDGNASRRGAEAQRKSGAGKVLAVLALAAVIGVGGLVYHQRLESESAAAAKAEPDKSRLEIGRVRTEQQYGNDLPDESLAEQEARRKEIAELAENRVDIAIKAENIADVMAKIAAYRNEPDGFAAHIANADEQRKIADGVGRSPATSAEAKAALKTLEDAERVIQREYNWLKTNKTARDEAKQIEAEIARDIVPVMERFKAGDYARVAYGKGDRLRKDGNAALSKGDFPEAKAKLSEAKKQLSAAAAEAKGFCIDTHLKTAKKWMAASKWQKCVEECDTILGWDAANAEAKRLKTEAENHLVPTAKVVATIDGREVTGAKLNDGTKDHLTPINWTLKDGANYGPYEVSYESGGRRYFGTFEAVTVDWLGQRKITVALKEYTGPRHGDVKKLTLPGGATMEMIYVGPGTFTMGSPSSEEGRENDETPHRVTLTKGFWLGKYEVTQKQWRSVMGSNPSVFKSVFKGDSNPVENVSWNDCQEFVRKVNDAARRQFGGSARLPTEAEWEYACRAGTTTAYCWGNALNGDRANCDGNYPCGTTAKGLYRERTVAVGSYQPNAWGFCDMHGNVWEWCQDWYGDYPVNSVTDPHGSASGVSRVLRGGGWGDFARNCRSALRYRDSPGDRYSFFGFRLCCSALP